MIRLYLLGKKGFECLKNLNSEHLSSIADIIVGKDENVQNDYSRDIHLLAQELDIPSFSKKKESENQSIKLRVAIGWRWIIQPAKNVLVFHDSLLPKYRGFNPLVTALINGDTEIGVTVIEGNDDFDTGNLVKQEKISISYPLKVKDAIEKLAILYSDLLNEVLADYSGKGLVSYAQDEKLASYSLWRDEDDYEIDWSQSAIEIKRFIDAVGYPYKGAKTRYDGKWVRIFDATPEKDVVIANRTPGKVLFKKRECYHIVCGIGLLSINDFYDDLGNPMVFQKSFRLKFG
ncbi:MAG: formyltransferase family protein [Saonia sp.]